LVRREKTDELEKMTEESKQYTTQTTKKLL